LLPRSARRRLRSSASGKFCITAVTGPDEYNTVVNNNAYTNLMARENLRYAVQTVRALRATKPQAYATLADRTALDDTEVEAWIRAAEGMLVPTRSSAGPTTSWMESHGTS
jgi:alpha,alpha-trehalose phosphorylase